MRRLAFALALILAASPALAGTVFTTLGTSGGPNPRANRSEPANLLTVDGMRTLVDAGDGVTERLAAKGVPVFGVDNLVISHLHFDHIGGLMAVLGLRFQTNPRAPLVIYGPPGTEEMVAGLMTAFAPAMAAAYGMPGARVMKPEDLVIAHDIRDGDSFMLGRIRVSAVKNTHYSFPAGSKEDQEYQSLSYRFDTPDRSIVYTGDTGPSAAVVHLAEGADLYVSEVIDLDAVLDDIRKSRPDLPAAQFDEIRTHLSTQHVTPADVGKMAQAAGVKSVVLTHLVAGREIAPAQTQGWVATIGESFHGPVTVAADGQDF